jgi:mono/diheme cytochrome c family protein
MRIIGAFCLAALPLLAQHEVDKDKKKQFIGDPKAIEAGHVLFANGCAACHGSEVKGGRGPNLREKVYWHPTDDEILPDDRKGYSGGRDARREPARNQIWQVVAFTCGP